MPGARRLLRHDPGAERRADRQVQVQHPRACGPRRGEALAGQEDLHCCDAPRHGRSHHPAGAHERLCHLRHANHGRHAAAESIHGVDGLLAEHQPDAQRPGQLQQPQRQPAHAHLEDSAGLCSGRRRQRLHRRRPEPARQACACERLCADHALALRALSRRRHRKHLQHVTDASHGALHWHQHQGRGRKQRRYLKGSCQGGHLPDGHHACRAACAAAYHSAHRHDGPAPHRHLQERAAPGFAGRSCGLLAGLHLWPASGHQPLPARGRAARRQAGARVPEPHNKGRQAHHPRLLQQGLVEG
eukprot:m.199580 g.199580  ORF g.199580 m.199580 type:complete len:301 (+) comp17684_c0_seq6:282-1184(+)